jgi:hypothetical protein
MVTSCVVTVLNGSTVLMPDSAMDMIINQFTSYNQFP